MNKILNWLNRNNTQLVWFLMGFFIYGAIDNFGRGNWYGMCINLLFAAMNYFINRR